MPRSRELAELATSYDSGGSLGFRNRIINGDCRIDQRNNGASVTIPATTSQFTLDRWMVQSFGANKFSVQQTPSATETGFGTRIAAGFQNYLGITSLAATSSASGDYYALFHFIEGFNVADLAWGTSAAKPIVLSFLVYSSLTGTFSGSLKNSADNRSYVFTYTVSAANTWTTININISGDTTGTWLVNNGKGLALVFDLGSGTSYRTTAGSWQAGNFYGATGATSVVATNGATFYITGVQLEAGSVATPFERRDYGRELIMCQRYYEKSYSIATTPGTVATSGFLWNYMGLSSGSVTDVGSTAHFKASKRATPTMTYYSPDTGASGKVSMCDSFGNAADANAQSDGVNENMSTVYGARATSVNAQIRVHWVASAEL
jgi:hypothetical protein